MHLIRTDAGSAFRWRAAAIRPGILSSSDGSTFELVCTSGAQGKCARFGYAPWRQAPDGRPMIDWYNACIRLCAPTIAAMDGPSPATALLSISTTISADTGRMSIHA